MKRNISKNVFFFLSRSSPGAGRTPRTRGSRTRLSSISGEEETEEDGERAEQHSPAVPHGQTGGGRSRPRLVHVQRVAGNCQLVSNPSLVCLFVVCLSVRSFSYKSECLFVCLSVCLFVCMSIYLSICLCLYLSVRLFVFVSDYL